jgi:integrase
MFCGTKQTAPAPRKQRTKSRGNGQGTVYKRGNKWAARYRHVTGDGKMISIYKGGFLTKKEGLDWLANLHTVQRTDPDISFEKLFEKWISRHEERVGKSTIDCYNAAYKHFSDLHRLPFARLTTEQLQQCVDSCGHGTRTKENMKALCTSLYKYAHEIGVTNDDYGQHIYIKRGAAQEEKRAFTDKELKKLFEVQPQIPNIDIVLVLCYTGFRLNELLKLRKEDYNAADNCFVGGGKTKAGTNRIVTISPKIKAFVLDRVMKTPPGGYVFGAENGKQLQPNKYRDRQKAALEAAGVRTLTPHECRHTFATLMKSVAAAKEDKKRLIGHASDEMLEHYTHAEIEDLKKITDQL